MPLPPSMTLDAHAPQEAQIAVHRLKLDQRCVGDEIAAADNRLEGLDRVTESLQNDLLATSVDPGQILSVLPNTLQDLDKELLQRESSIESTVQQVNTDLEAWSAIEQRKSMHVRQSSLSRFVSWLSTDKEDANTTIVEPGSGEQAIAGSDAADWASCPVVREDGQIVLPGEEERRKALRKQWGYRSVLVMFTLLAFAYSLRKMGLGKVYRPMLWLVKKLAYVR